MNPALQRACNGMNVQNNGLNVPEMRKELKKLLPISMHKEIDKATRPILEKMCKEYVGSISTNKTTIIKHPSPVVIKKLPSPKKLLSPKKLPSPKKSLSPKKSSPNQFPELYDIGQLFLDELSPKLGDTSLDDLNLHINKWMVGWKWAEDGTVSIDECSELNTTWWRKHNKPQIVSTYDAMGFIFPKEIDTNDPCERQYGVYDYYGDFPKFLDLPPELQQNILNTLLIIGAPRIRIRFGHNIIYPLEASDASRGITIRDFLNFLFAYSQKLLDDPDYDSKYGLDPYHYDGPRIYWNGIKKADFPKLQKVYDAAYEKWKNENKDLFDVEFSSSDWEKRNQPNLEKLVKVLQRENKHLRSLVH